jgi:alkaline phosphatase D
MAMDDKDKGDRLRRRTVVKGLAASSLVPLLGANLLGCSDSSGGSPPINASFEHGVASGDPLTDRVIIWTRLTPEREGSVRVVWEVAADPDFNDIRRDGRGDTNASVDYTVKVDVEGLDPGEVYYYRFRVLETLSPVGRTRTLPGASVAAAGFAVISCSNYPAGFFNVYREIAGLDVDAVLHLGDYLYEYDRNGYASERAEEFGRVVDPTTELYSLEDYRTRYRQYHTDEDLQSAHAAHPWFLVWDDHEVANDAWREGAENHDPETEGSFTERRAAAIQAWYEWLPVRPPEGEDEIIYRRFTYGDLLDLIMLDTRLIGRDEQLSYDDYSNGGMIDVDAARAAFNDSNRTLLGDAQLQWLKAQLTDSVARWQVLGQQVLMGNIALPSPIIEALDPEDPDIGAGTAAVLASVAAKNTPPEERTEEQQALLDSAIPYNLDAWDGYAFERDNLLAHAAQLDSNLVVVAGDTHNAWASQLRAPDGNIAGVEFACASVSSPGLEAFLGPDAATVFGPLVVTLVDDLSYANLVSRGYLVVRFDRQQVTASWRYIDTVFSTTYAVDETQSVDTSVDASDMRLG